MAEPSFAMKELLEVFDDLDTLLKNPEVGAELTARGVNLSLAIVAADAVRAYVEGDRARAAEDFETVAEEISSRLAASKSGTDGEGSAS
jgi:hypothetical protein